MTQTFTCAASLLSKGQIGAYGPHDVTFECGASAQLLLVYCSGTYYGGAGLALGKC